MTLYGMVCYYYHVVTFPFNSWYANEPAMMAFISLGQPANFTPGNLLHCSHLRKYEIELCIFSRKVSFA